jgi:hypothetical protein
VLKTKSHEKEYSEYGAKAKKKKNKLMEVK